MPAGGIYTMTGSIMTDTRHDGDDTDDSGDRRAAPRLEERLAASLRARDVEVQGWVADLSRNGACIEGDKALADLLLAAGRHAGTAEKPELTQMRFSVPDDGGTSLQVIVQARVVYVVHMHADSYRCGLEFRQFVEGEAAFTSCLHASGLVD